MSENGGNIIYDGFRQDGRAVVMRLEMLDDHAEVSILDPAPSQELWNHSPDGFEWGYGGSGPAQLALALLFDATGDSGIAVRYHQEFKNCFVTYWGANWRMDAGQIRCWAALKEKSEGTEGG